MMPKMVSLVPSEIATMPSRTRPVPTRLQGLSPDQATMRAAGQAVPAAASTATSVPRTVQDSASGGSLVSRFGAVARERLRRPLLRRQIHEVHARAVARVDRHVRAGEQRREPRADEMDAIGRGVGGGLVLGKLPDLRPGEALERARAGEAGERARPPDRRFDGGALAGRARVHPDRRRAAREHVGELIGERLRRIERAQPLTGARRSRTRCRAAGRSRRSRAGGSSRHRCRAPGRP